MIRSPRALAPGGMVGALGRLAPRHFAVSDPAAPAAPRTAPPSSAGSARAILGGGVGRRTTPPSETIVYLEDVVVDYDGFKALSRVNFVMDRRELRVVIGPNGAGKTTLLDVISGRVKPASGRVIFGHHTDLVPLAENAIATLGVGRKFQTPSVFVNLTVRDNVELSLRRPSKGVWSTLLGRERAGDERGRIDAMLERIGLAGKAGRRAGALSHGEKQWLEIGMVMAQEPELLLVDEPVAGMTDEETARTGELLLDIARDRAVLVIEHDMEFVRQIARTVTVLHLVRLQPGAAARLAALHPEHVDRLDAVWDAAERHARAMGTTVRGIVVTRASRGCFAVVTAGGSPERDFSVARCG
jgi:urea transport system ATP-binding protein